MARRPYRVEVNYPKQGKPQYYLVRDVGVRGLRRKVRKYLGTKPLTREQVEHCRREHAAEMELRTALKKGELSAGALRSEHLDGEQHLHVEQVRYLSQSVGELMGEAEAAVYEREFEASYVQGTTAIEGNTLTLGETSDLLRYGIAPEGHSLREVNEVQNFRKVASYRNKYRGRASLDFIRALHRLVMDNIDFDSAGNFRRLDTIGIAGADIRLTPAPVIEAELQEAIEEYYARLDAGFNPFEQAVLFHYRFEMVHPFTDGNGRVGREILNWMLRCHRYPRLLFLGRERGSYLAALRKGNVGDFAGLLMQFAKLLVGQRLERLRENLEQLASVAPQKRGQLSLSDFIDF